MITGKISKLDLAARTAVIRTESGEEYTLRVPEGASIAVSEPCTMGMMGGDLHDLEVGYWVQAEVGQHDHEGLCHCGTLVSIS